MWCVDVSVCANHLRGIVSVRSFLFSNFAVLLFSVSVSVAFAFISLFLFRSLFKLVGRVCAFVSFAQIYYYKHFIASLGFILTNIFLLCKYLQRMMMLWTNRISACFWASDSDSDRVSVPFFPHLFVLLHTSRVVSLTIEWTSNRSFGYSMQMACTYYDLFECKDTSKVIFVHTKGQCHHSSHIPWNKKCTCKWRRWGWFYRLSLCLSACICVSSVIIVVETTSESAFRSSSLSLFVEFGQLVIALSKQNSMTFLTFQ